MQIMPELCYKMWMQWLHKYLHVATYWLPLTTFAYSNYKRQRQQQQRQQQQHLSFSITDKRLKRRHGSQVEQPVGAGNYLVIVQCAEQCPFAFARTFPSNNATYTHTHTHKNTLNLTHTHTHTHKLSYVQFFYLIFLRACSCSCCCCCSFCSLA